MTSAKQYTQDKVTEENKGRLHKGYYRNGENHRGGADVSFGDIVKIFGFRGVEIGRWVSQEEQQIAANLFFDALCDLSDILAVPNQVISLNGSLAINFGKGGRKGAFAHYNSATRTLALAKNAGGGALAHEWFHAFDHYICRKMYQLDKAHTFATEIWLNESTALVEHPLNMLMSKAFSAMFLSDDGISPSELMSKSIAVDSQHKIFYYARPQEVGARAFERMVQESSIKNSFLAAGTMQSKEAQIGLYPSGKALRNLSQALSEYFFLLGKALAFKAQK